ncbi:hypothetical protein BDY17DRAFT_306281 [Neohortaea acidophila]|uniref:Uncharacterized protein n=1 Tax=Neohortaea acidophila TaxID=245834 RepID=A0A6A6PEQ3_9PEZI|nr:uncharacterized protein BDY17DRAFT_306281 [Neohortaea acidophila]KAF2478449.1 hypothetical protein BDY17DRAFT_306281 [Neohortaea acidophila]
MPRLYCRIATEPLPYLPESFETAAPPNVPFFDSISLSFHKAAFEYISLYVQSAVQINQPWRPRQDSSRQSLRDLHLQNPLQLSCRLNAHDAIDTKVQESGARIDFVNIVELHQRRDGGTDFVRHPSFELGSCSWTTIGISTIAVFCLHR